MKLRVGTTFSIASWALLLGLLLLSGCAQWKQMTPQERKVVIGTGVAAALVAGAIAAHDDDHDPAPIPQWQPWDQHHFCVGKDCK
jgi:hypothetical protein